MLELLQRLVKVHWRRSGAVIRQITISGSQVWYADFPRRAEGRPARRSDGASVGRGPPRRPRSAATVVLLHGLGGTSTSFYPVIHELRRAYRVVVPDLPGHGMSRPPPGRQFLAFSELVEVTERIVSRVAPRGAYVAGNSMGGWLAVKLAARRPELVRGLALLNPGGPALRAEDWVDFARLILADERGAVDEWLQRIFHKPPPLVRFFMRDFRRIMRTPPVSTFVANIRPEDFLSEEEMEQVRCPAVLVWGERDRLIPDGCRSFYLRKLKGVRYEPVPDCGHCPQIECPNRTAEILLQLPHIAEKRPQPFGVEPGGGAASAIAARRRGGLRAVARVQKT